MSQAGRRSDPRAEWMKAVAARRGFNRAVIAVANKMGSPRTSIAQAARAKLSDLARELFEELLVSSGISIGA